MGKVKKTFSLDEEVAERLSRYAAELHVSDSAFVSLMVMQLDQVMKVGLGEEQEDSSRPQGEI